MVGLIISICEGCKDLFDSLNIIFIRSRGYLVDIRQVLMSGTKRTCIVVVMFFKRSEGTQRFQFFGGKTVSSLRLWRRRRHGLFNRVVLYHASASTMLTPIRVRAKIFFFIFFWFESQSFADHSLVVLSLDALRGQSLNIMIFTLSSLKKDNSSTECSFILSFCSLILS